MFAATAALAFAVFTTGCQSKTDLGAECQLIKSNACKKDAQGNVINEPCDSDPSDGTDSTDIREEEIVAGKDFISFGSTDCIDLVCIRDASDPKGTEPFARGFCSRSCIQTSEVSCLTGDEKVDKATPFVCRSLILDETTLLAIKQADPERYKKTFGDTESPYFCAKPAVAADGGT